MADGTSTSPHSKKHDVIHKKVGPALKQSAKGKARSGSKTARLTVGRYDLRMLLFST